MFKQFTLLLMLITSISLTAQEKQHNYILKTNLLNIFLIPSAHLEVRLAERSSMVLNFHRGKLVFITENNWLNVSLDYKKYFSNNTNLTGLYLSPGVLYNYDYEGVKLDLSGNVIKYGISSIGGIVRLGYQFGFKENYIFDLGTGLAMLKEVESNYEDKVRAELRLMVGVGIKF